MAKKQRRCPQCHRVVVEMVSTYQFCSTALTPTQHQVAQKQPPGPARRLRDIFPMLDYDGYPLPRGGEAHELSNERFLS
jgi:hypothetical protein